jgi:uroporphyrinogen-III decarboxylase
VSLGSGSIGVFTLATDLRGPDIYLDTYARPEFLRELLRIVTDKVIGRHRWLQSLGCLTGAGTGLVDDASSNLSPWLYREFVVPCVLRVVEAIGRPLRIHVDGPADHLLPIYRELGIDELMSFGPRTAIEKVREYLGGRALLSGNVDPLLFVRGTPADVYREASRVLEVLAGCGGLILQDGNNLPPEASIDSIAAMVRAAEDFGLP